MFGDQRLPERFWNKCIPEPNSGCWLWFGCITGAGDGYGYISTKRRKSPERAHRVSYEALVGKIPEGLELDHLCRTSNCVNPHHLEAVTGAVNLQRRVFRPRTRKETCIHGHRRTIRPNGQWRCLECHRLREKARRDAVEV